MDVLLCYNTSIAKGAYMNYYIYKTTTTINNKYYIGARACKGSIEEDIHYFGSGKVIKELRLQYGEGIFLKEILEVCECKETLAEAERKYVNKREVSDKHCYNQRQGGGGNIKGCKHTEERNKNLSEKLTGRKQSEAHKKRKGDAIRGEKNGMFGRKHTEESKAKMSNTQLGVPATDKQKEAASKGQKLRWANAIIYTCVHCGKESKNKGMLNRWHNDNCKKRLIE